jgi:tight adherence protein C
LIIVMLGMLMLAGLAVALVLRAAALPQLEAAQRLGTVHAYGYAPTQQVGVGESDDVITGLDGFAHWVGEFMSRRYNSKFNEDDIRAELVAAGMYTTQPLAFLGYRAIATIVLPLGFTWLLVSAGTSMALVLCFALLTGAFGWRAPIVYVERRMKDRLERVDLDLPELIDLLIVTIEAGIGFNASLQMAAGRIHGPLGEELRLTLQEQSMGLSSGESLEHMMARADTPSMRSFVRSILQGEQLGVSIGQILRNLANEMRKRRRAKAEERAQKAPIKMLFPLVFLIFPAIFIVLLFPATVTFMNSMAGIT